MLKYKISILFMKILIVYISITLCLSCSIREKSRIEEKQNNVNKYLEIFISGSGIESADALMHLIKTPKDVMENTEILLDALSKCRNEFDGDYCPTAMGTYKIDWTRPEFALVALADAIRSIPLKEQRRGYQDSMMGFCEQAIDSDYTRIRASVVYEAAVRCVFYTGFLFVEPEYGIDKHLEILRKLIDRHCKNSGLNPTDEVSFYKICAHTEIEEAIESHIFDIEASSGPYCKQYLDVLGIQSQIARTMNYSLYESIKESELFALRGKTTDELIALYKSADDKAPIYREVIEYLLFETKMKQSENIEKVLKEYDIINHCFYRYILQPIVYDFSIGYMKNVMDRYLEFAENEVHLDKEPSLKERPLEDKIVCITMHFESYIENAYSSDKFSQLYRKDRIINLLLTLVKFSDDTVHRKAMEALGRVVSKDGEYGAYIKNEIKKIDEKKLIELWTYVL